MKDNTEKPDKTKKPATIYVNTRPHDVAKDEISYLEVVQLANPGVVIGEDTIATVAYRRGNGNKEGTLVAGQSVKVKEGMIFDVHVTTRS
jgi:hypothetical protein